MSATEKRYTRPLDDGTLGDIIVKITPESSGASTPTIEGGFSDSFIPSEHDPLQNMGEMGQHLQYDPVQHMVSLIDPSNPLGVPGHVVISSEQKLCEYLRMAVVKLRDLELMVPTLKYNNRVMGALATNIGINRSRGKLSNTKIDIMLTHILANDTTEDSVYNRTLEQISRFRLSKEEHRLRRQGVQQLIDRITREASQKAQQAQEAREEDMKLKERYASIPQEYHQTSYFLPMNCTSIAQFVAEVDGMHWTQAAAITDKHNEVCAAAAQLGLSKKEALKLGTTLELPSKVAAILEKGSWAQTRTHNVPGISEKKKGKGRKCRLPTIDGRMVMGVGVPMGRDYEEIEGACGWAQSVEPLDEDKDVAKVVVRLP